LSQISRPLSPLFSTFSLLLCYEEVRWKEEERKKNERSMGKEESEKEIVA